MSGQPPIRVFIVDDHALLRSGLKQFIDSYDDMVLAGEARNGAEAVATCLADPPDVILMDLVMPVMDGIEATRQIMENNKNLKVVILTTFYDHTHVQQALQAGAISYLLKNASAEELALAVRSTYAGRSALAPEVAETLIHATRQKKTVGADLSDREREVLGLLVEGLTNAQIAAKLSISLATVKFHVGAILSKLGVENRSQAVTLAWQNDLVCKK